MAFAQLVAAVPFYQGLTLEDIGGRGLRWPEREQASSTLSVGDKSLPATQITQTTPGAEQNGGLRLGTYRPSWAAPEVEISPSLQFTIARQQAELSPEDARRLNISSGDRLEVAQNATTIEATAAVRSGVPEGTVFLATGIAVDSANALTEPEVEVRKLAQLVPALVDGVAE
jgi:NADH-quinone oxidoreductase subunit G